MKKARFLFLAALVVMAIAAFKGNPRSEDIPSIQHPPVSVHVNDSTSVR